MKRVDNLYKDIANFYSIYDMTNNVCTSVRNKKKVDKFETFKMEHIYHIYNKLKKKDFTVGKYNIFMISDPKCRIVMVQDIEDKIMKYLEYNILSNNMNDILNRIDEILKSYV